MQVLIVPISIAKERAKSFGSATGSTHKLPMTKPHTCNTFMLSDPGEDNYSGLNDIDGMLDEVDEAMQILAEHSWFQRRHYAVATRPSKDWPGSIPVLVAALLSTQNDDVRGEIAVCMGQQNEEMRFAFIQAGACAALVKALTIQNQNNEQTNCSDDSRCKIDFALRSLARHPIGRERACVALVDALMIANSSGPSAELHVELQHDLSKRGVLFVIGKFAENEDMRSALINSGVFPALVASVALARDQTICLISDAITALSCDAANRVSFIRNILQHVLGRRCAPPSAFAKTAFQQTQLRRMLQEISTRFDEALALAPGGQFGLSVAHSLISMLLEALNLHLQIRSSDLLDCNKDCKAERQACYTNFVIGCCIRFLGVLLSKNDEHESNFNEGLSSVLTGDIIAGFPYDPWSSSSFLNSITRRVIVIKRPGSAWNVTVDCKAQPEDDSLSARSSRYTRRNIKPDVNDSSMLIAPLQEYAAAAAVAAANGSCQFNDAVCAVCQSSLFEIKSDGSIVVIARQLKCFESNRQQTGHAACALRPPPSNLNTHFLFQTFNSGTPTFCKLNVHDSASFSTAALNALSAGV